MLVTNTNIFYIATVFKTELNLKCAGFVILTPVITLI